MSQADIVAKAAQSQAFFAAYGQAIANTSRAGTPVRGCYPPDYAQTPWNPGVGGIPQVFPTGVGGGQGAIAIAAARSAAFYAPPTVAGQVCVGATPPPCCTPIAQ